MNIIGDYEAHKRDEEWDKAEDRRLARLARKTQMADGRMHDFVGPNRSNVHVHCSVCGKIFEISKAKGYCSGVNPGGQP
jgi:hypothetical protein